MKKIILFSLLAFTAASLSAQESRESVVTKAMGDEMQRNMSISLPGQPSPLFMKYTLSDMGYISVTSVLGSTVSAVHVPRTSQVGIQIMVGDEHLTNTLDYSGKINSFAAPIDDSYDQFRTMLWEGTDQIYKHSLKEYQVKMSALQQMQIPEQERAMMDITPIEHNSSKFAADNYNSDVDQYKKVADRLSERFKSYPRLRNTYATIGSIDSKFLSLTSEGDTIRYNVPYYYISAYAESQNSDGVVMRGNFVKYAFLFNEISDEKMLEEELTKLADRMDELVDAEPIAEYYCGPVMFIDDAVSNLFSSSLISMDGGLISYKALMQNSWLLNPMERRVDRRVIDSRFTISNLTSLESYEDVKLMGYYTHDSEGVKPADKLTLIENGMLRNILSSRTGTVASKESTGSMRYMISQSGVSSNIAPGTLLIESSDNTKYSRMRHKLIKLAKEDKQKYAYIVANMASASPDIIQIDIKSGKQTRVNNTKIQEINMQMLRRVPYVSSEQRVYNSLAYGGIPYSVIAPKAIIVSDVEIDTSNTSREQKPVMEYPLQR